MNFLKIQNAISHKLNINQETRGGVNSNSSFKIKANYTNVDITKPNGKIKQGAYDRLKYLQLNSKTNADRSELESLTQAIADARDNYDEKETKNLQLFKEYRELKDSKGTFNQSIALEKLSQLEQEPWNRLDQSELWAGGDGTGWTGSKYFSVEGDDIFINPKGVKDLIDFYHKKAANQASIDKSKLPKATILTCSNKLEKSTSSEGYLSSICTPEAREKYKGTTQVFLIEEGSDEKNHNNSSHHSSLYIKYDQIGNMTIVALDPVPKFLAAVKNELNLNENDKAFYQEQQIQHSQTGCKVFALKTYKQFLDELDSGHDMIDFISQHQGNKTNITTLPEGVGRLAQSRTAILGQQQRIQGTPEHSSHKDHSFQKTSDKYLREKDGRMQNTAVSLFNIKMALTLCKINKGQH